MCFGILLVSIVLDTFVSFKVVLLFWLLGYALLAGLFEFYGAAGLSAFSLLFY